MKTQRIVGVALVTFVSVGLTAGSAWATFARPADGDTNLNMSNVNGNGTTFGHHVRATT